MDLFTRSHAVFSDCRLYRYRLERRWGEGVLGAFLMLNPSTADEFQNDPTIRRCVAFARMWGYGGLMMTNLFAWRATDPRNMLAADDPVGPDNDQTLRATWLNAAITVAAWGAHGTHQGRGAHVRAMLPALHYLRLTKDGHPGHPLYLPASLRPVQWVTPNAKGNRPA